MNKQDLHNVINDFLGLGLEFDIDVKKLDEYTEDTLKEEISEASLLLEDGDTLEQITINTLQELEIDIPAGIKVKKAAKKVPVKKAAAKKVEKAPVKKTVKKQVKTKDKPKAKKAVKKTTAKKDPVKKAAAKKVEKEMNAFGNSVSQSELYQKATKMIEAGKYTKQQIVDKLLNDEELNKTKSSIVTMLVDGKNEKYCRFAHLVQQDEETKVLSFVK